MKKKISTAFLMAAILVLFTSLVNYACQKTSGQQPLNLNSTETAHSVPIPADSANLMIQSYLDGIDYTKNTNEIRSLVCDADRLHTYLSNSAVKSIKLIFAHNMEWIDNGHYGQRPGPNQNAITIIIAGLDSDQHYLSYPTVEASLSTQSLVVLDRLDPCPYDCMGSDLVE